MNDHLRKSKVSETPDKDPRDEDIDAELEEADSTAILVGILTELQFMNQQLAELRGKSLEQGESETQGFECDTCENIVGEDERRDHLERKHNAPPGIDVSEHFTPQ